jgi:hypothetical protein
MGQEYLEFETQGETKGLKGEDMSKMRKGLIRTRVDYALY